VIGKVDVLNHPVDVIAILVESIKTPFIPNPQEDQDATGHPYRKTCDIDEGIALMAC
jgi:hypothetical protein